MYVYFNFQSLTVVSGHSEKKVQAMRRICLLNRRTVVLLCGITATAQLLLLWRPRWGWPVLPSQTAIPGQSGAGTDTYTGYDVIRNATAPPNHLPAVATRNLTTSERRFDERGPSVDFYRLWHSQKDSLCGGAIEIYNRTVVVFRDIFLDPSRALALAKGGESMDSVMKQKEENDFFTF